MTIEYNGHVETLSYGWWERKRGHVMLPETIGDKRNWVLKLDELKALQLVLREHREQLDKEVAKINATVFALEKGYASSMRSQDPTCYTIAHGLEFLAKYAKMKLAVLQWMLPVTQARVELKRKREAFNIHEDTRIETALVRVPKQGEEQQ